MYKLNRQIKTIDYHEISVVSKLSGVTPPKNLSHDLSPFSFVGKLLHMTLNAKFRFMSTVIILNKTRSTYLIRVVY